MNVENELPEPSEKLEIRDSENDDCSEDEIVPPKNSINGNARSRETRTFSKEIPTTPISSLSDTLPDLITKRLFYLWSSFITNEILEVELVRKTK